MLFTHILFQQHGRQYRHQCQCKNKRAQQGKSQGISQRTEHLPLHFLESKDRDQRSDNDQFGEEHRLSTILCRMTDQPHLTHYIKGRHPHLPRFPVKGNKKTFHHHHGTIDNDPEVDRPHRKQIGTHPHRPKADKGKEQRQRDNNGYNHRCTPVCHKNQHNESYQ